MSAENSAVVSGVQESQQLYEAMALAVREAIDDADPGWSALVSGNAPATHTGGPAAMFRSMTAIRDRSDGRYYPFYETERDLERERVKWRRLATFSSVAIGAMAALESYTMGGDWSFEVVARPEQNPSSDLIAEVQRIVDAILEKNKFSGDLDREIHAFSREDGESLVAGYSTRDGLVDLRRIDAESLREPLETRKLNDWLGVDDRESSWTFGVHTVYDERQRRTDHERHVGYHVVFDDSGADWDYLPAWPQATGDDELDGKFVQYVKRNTPRKAKRGVSDYWPVLVDLEREDKLNENTTVGAAVQAAIAWWEEMPPNASREGVEQQVSAALDNFSASVASARGGTRSINKMAPGTVPKLSAGRKLIAGPLGQQRSPIFIEVRQAVMRRIGLRWTMPEYMITGDASNSNFASTLVAESPFVKARESDQKFYVSQFRELLSKCLKVAADAGRFAAYTFRGRSVGWRELAMLVDLKIQPPSVATRDKTELQQELFGLYDRGIATANEVRVALKRDAVPELDGKTGGGVATAPGQQPGQQPGQPPVAPAVTQLASIEQRHAARNAALGEAILEAKTLDEARSLAESCRGNS